MTPFCNVVMLILIIGCIRSISGAAFSNVIVQRGPLDYINYNPSALSFASPQLAQLSAGPIESVVSIPSVSSLVSPCVSPCVIPNGHVSGLAQIPATNNAKIVAYKSSLANVPVILSNKDDARGYQYAYAVFDESTGDKKTQSEHSDGSVVQGQYSFIQPDGFRREVVYTADDSKGFNAVVRNISPEPEHHKEEKAEEKKETAKPVPPCNEVKNEHLTHAHAPHSHEESSEEAHSEVEHMEEKKGEEKSAETSEEKSGEKSAEASAEKVDHSHEEVHHVPAVETAPQSNAIISYHDIINCLQTKLKGAQNVVSPLTYVLVPSSRGPC